MSAERKDASDLNPLIMSEPDSSDPSASVKVISSWRIWVWRIGIAAWLGVLVAALIALHREWSGFHLHDLNAAISRLGPKHLGLAVGCTVLSYLCNAAIDLFSLRWLGLKIPVSTALGRSFVAAAFSLNAGGTILGGGGVRVRLYSALGVPVADIAKMAGFAAFAGWSGNAMVAGILLILSPQFVPWLPAGGGLALAGLLLVSVGVSLAFNHWRRSRAGEGSFFPPTWLLAGAVIMSAVDWLMAGMAIRVLLPEDLGQISTAGFLGIVLFSQLLSAISHVPGGAGVLELSISKLVGSALPTAWLAAALLTYRLVFYLSPFVVALAWMGGREVWAHRHHLVRSVDSLGGVWRRLGPRLGPLTALAAGFILMVSANTPIETGRRLWLMEWIPLPFVETSHFLSSIVGVAMIVVARGLQRRVSAAWWAAVFLSCGGVVFSLLKGVDYEEASVLGFLLLCLLPHREHFHRHAAVWSRRFTLEWWLLLIALLAVALWLGFFTSRHIEYQHELWWQFSFDGDASRFLRAQVGTAVLLTVLVLCQCFRRTPPRVADEERGPTFEQWEKVCELVSRCDQSQSHLALLGDKMFYFSGSGESFLMYGEQGRSRVVMGEPIGNEEEWDDLLWAFNEKAEDEGFRVCHYQISALAVPRYVDMGMSLFKLGEEARVNLRKFSLDGPDSRRLRKSRSRAERDDLSFEIWDPLEVREKMELLRAISDDWLEETEAREKGFSLGRFSEGYLSHHAVAVACRSGKPVAFANLWCGENPEEMSVDLMRHHHEAPNCTMDYLFSELFLWGQAQGYLWFSLGMAPLSGLVSHPLAPLWQKLGAMIYLRGNAFYNFQGLREFKEKFHPDWQSRYLAVPSSWHLPLALSDITALIGGGWKNVIIRGKS